MNDNMNLENNRYENYMELGIDKYQILCTLDMKTCPICAKRDLKVFDMKDYEENVTAPPFHKNCRCTTIPFFDNEFNNIGQRVARNPVTNKTYYIPQNISYQKWILSMSKRDVDTNG